MSCSPPLTFSLKEAPLLVFSRPFHTIWFSCFWSVGFDSSPSSRHKSISYTSTSFGLSRFTASYAFLQSCPGRREESTVVSKVLYRGGCTRPESECKTTAAGAGSWRPGLATSVACCRDSDGSVSVELAELFDEMASSWRLSALFRPIPSRIRESRSLNGMISS